MIFHINSQIVKRLLCLILHIFQLFYYVSIKRNVTKTKVHMRVKIESQGRVKMTEGTCIKSLISPLKKTCENFFLT